MTSMSGQAALQPIVLDHVTVRTADLEGTRAFFETVFELKPGFRPDFPFPGYWLYAGAAPLVHLVPGRASPVDRTGETIDHVAFRLADAAAWTARLDRLGVPFTRTSLPELGETRIFVFTPAGIRLELVFRDVA